ncbi:MAG: daunorubicin ABC transporter ATP-binding protein [Acidimicrobiaceae bacterium]|nr:daunorubicin ABC transporter ATP-binding protein [Acidimicrobiaceae bacterium]
MRSSSATHVVAHGLVRRFGDLTAVDGIDLDVGEGEIFGFLGPNGAGKSTTVRMLVTLLKPSAGSASVAGFDVASQPNEVRRRIGVALQDAAIDPLMTGNESLRLQAVMQGLGGRPGQQRAEGLLERVGLTEAGDRRVGTYSGGMRRRLDLALALIHKPSVLFLDEPTTGLDPTSRQAVWEEVRSLNDEGTTVFLTTQYLEEADQLAGRIAIIDGGTIVREGDPAALKEAVGDPTLRLEVADPSRQEAAQGILARFGGERPARAGRIAIGLRGGTGSLASVIRALDEAGIAVGHVEVDSPSLDDVFADATGRRLEGAGS